MGDVGVIKTVIANRWKDMIVHHACGDEEDVGPFCRAALSVEVRCSEEEARTFEPSSPWHSVFSPSQESGVTWTEEERALVQAAIDQSLDEIGRLAAKYAIALIPFHAPESMARNRVMADLREHWGLSPLREQEAILASRMIEAGAIVFGEGPTTFFVNLRTEDDLLNGIPGPVPLAMADVGIAGAFSELLRLNGVYDYDYDLVVATRYDAVPYARRFAQRREKKFLIPMDSMDLGPYRGMRAVIVGGTINLDAPRLDTVTALAEAGIAAEGIVAVVNLGRGRHWKRPPEFPVPVSFILSAESLIAHALAVRAIDRASYERRMAALSVTR